MSAPDPDGIDILSKVVLALVALVLAPIVALWLWFEGRFVRRAELDAVWKEMDRRRERDDHIEALIREHINEERDRVDQYHRDNQARFDQLVAQLGDVRAAVAAFRREQ